MTREMEYLPMTALERQYLGRKPRPVLNLTEKVLLALGLVVVGFVLWNLPLPEAEASETPAYCDDTCICADLSRYDTRGMEEAVADYCDKFGGV